MAQLTGVRDPRVVDLWVRIARAPSYGRRLQAIWELGTWDEPPVVEALVGALHTRPEELGAEDAASREMYAGMMCLSAAQTLAQSPRPTALAALLGERDSSDDQVRLTVLGRLARLPPEQARPHLERFAHDRYALVRSEAERYLRELDR